MSPAQRQLPGLVATTWMRGSDVGERTCSIEGCDGKVVARGWCRKHYGRWHRHGDLNRGRIRNRCTVQACGAEAYGHGYCLKHYARWRKHGSTERRPRTNRRDYRVGDTHRRCPGCDSVKPNAEFHRDSSAWDGYKSKCKACLRERRRERETPEVVARRNERRAAAHQANLEERRRERREKYAADPRDRMWAQRRRIRKKTGADVVPIDNAAIFDRDGWLCGICGDPIDPTLRWPASGSASLDHVVPLARGGLHVEANVQASHLGCNLSKKDSMPA